MQKKIIALAVAGLVSGGAFAQSNVTISGLLDVGVFSSKAENVTRSNNAAYNGTGTSVIAFRAQEDLGGGMKAGAFFETDIRGAGAFANFQRFVFINGGFGELSFGQRTNFSTTTAVTAQPFGTAIGGGWSGPQTAAAPFAFTRTTGGGFEAGGAFVAGGRDVRADGSVRYDSPNFNGLTAGLSWKPKNTDTTETLASNGHLNLGVNYNNGPLNVSFAHAKYDAAVGAGAGTAATVSATCAAGETLVGNVCYTTATGVVGGATTFTPVAAVAGAAAYNAKLKHNLLAANYTFGATTIYGGYTTSKGNMAGAANDVDSRSWNIAAKYALNGNVDLLANYLKDNNKVAGAVDPDRKLFALGADYKFSKRTSTYFRYQSFDTNTNAAGGKNTTYGAGLIP